MFAKIPVFGTAFYVFLRYMPPKIGGRMGGGQHPLQEDILPPKSNTLISTISHLITRTLFGLFN